MKLWEMHHIGSGDPYDATAGCWYGSAPFRDLAGADRSRQTRWLFHDACSTWLERARRVFAGGSAPVLAGSSAPLVLPDVGGAPLGAKDALRERPFVRATGAGAGRNGSPRALALGDLNAVARHRPRPGCCISCARRIVLQRVVA